MYDDDHNAGNATTAPPLVATRVPTSTNTVTTKTFASVAATPVTTPGTSMLNTDCESETINITVGEKPPAPKSRPQKEPEMQHSEPYQQHLSTGFKAARRKNVTSYFIGNIDIDATKQDIYDHMKYNEVTPTFINVYYGRNGAAAKVNVHVDDEDKVEDPHFWPNDIVFRKWVSKEEWQKEKPNFLKRPRQQHYQHRRYDGTERRNYGRTEERGPRHLPRTQRDDNRNNNYHRASRYDDHGNDHYYDDNDHYDRHEWDRASID